MSCKICSKITGMISDEIALRLLSLITINDYQLNMVMQSFLVFKRAVFLRRSLNTLFQFIYIIWAFIEPFLHSRKLQLATTWTLNWCSDLLTTKIWTEGGLSVVVSKQAAHTTSEFVFPRKDESLTRSRHRWIFCTSLIETRLRPPEKRLRGCQLSPSLSALYSLYSPDGDLAWWPIKQLALDCVNACLNWNILNFSRTFLLSVFLLVFWGKFQLSVCQVTTITTTTSLTLSSTWRFQ